jgi:hypothetical protein
VGLRVRVEGKRERERERGPKIKVFILGSKAWRVHIIIPLTFRCFGYLNCWSFFIVISRTFGLGFGGQLLVVVVVVEELAIDDGMAWVWGLGLGLSLGLSS